MTLIDGRYEPSGSCGVGGMGSVVRCTDKVLKREVAIKFLTPGTDRGRIHDEAQALERVRSPHVVQMYDVLVLPPNNQIGLVQEFVDGKDLVELAAAGVSGVDAKRYLYQIACGLADTHAAGVIHRDIKPNNMKVDPEGVVKLFDFGLARSFEKASTRGFRGTPGFAAPELFRAGVVEFSSQIDVFGFGATALYLVTNSLPLTMQQSPPAPSGTEFAGLGFHSEIQNLLQLCLSVDSTKRPRIADVRDTLRRHLAQDRHRALLTFQGKTYRLDSSRKTVNLQRPSSTDIIGVVYDGLDFEVSQVQGDVFINNVRPGVGTKIRGSCLITLGTGRERAYVTFDVSHPEVVV